jgi:hypothetical protein
VGTEEFAEMLGEIVDADPSTTLAGRAFRLIVMIGQARTASGHEIRI